MGDEVRWKEFEFKQQWKQNSFFILQTINRGTKTEFGDDRTPSEKLEFKYQVYLQSKR